MKEVPTSAELALLASSRQPLHDAPLVMLWSCGFSRHAYMYEPVALTLIAGFQEAGAHVVRGIGTKRSDRPSFVGNYSLLGHGDFFVWIGICEWHQQPWELLRTRGVRRILYQSEPTHDCYGLTSKHLDELWDYSLHNIDSCRTKTHRPPVLRYVPLGAVPTLVRPPTALPASPPKLVFLGLLSEGHPERRRCLMQLRDALAPVTSSLQLISGAWNPTSFQQLVDGGHVYVNVHKHCGDAHQPVTFRHAKLLNAEAGPLLSEPSYPADEREYAGMVTFLSNMSAIATEYMRLRVMSDATRRGAGPARRRGRAAAAAFRRSFQPRDIFWRAGLYADQPPTSSFLSPLRTLRAPPDVPMRMVDFVRGSPQSFG